MESFKTPERFKGRTGLQIFIDRWVREGPPPKPMAGRKLKDRNDSMPDWKPDANGVYQNDYFYGGNLLGIKSRLDYIKENGFDIIYLSPLGLSDTSHHYDPTDQLQIDPWIGTWEDFQELCKEAHRRDMLIVVDLVYNHMGVKSPIFQDALTNPNSFYHDWFEWDEQGNPIFWGGFTNMPQTNKYNPGFQEYSCQVSLHYIKMGADGIRYDLGENFPEVFMNKQRAAIKAVNPEVLLVNEAWDFDNHREHPQLDGKQEDSDMDYPLADAIIRWVRYGNFLHFEYNVRELLKYPKQAQDVFWNLLDSHDTPRAINLLAGEGILEDPYEGACWDIEGPWRHPRWFDTYGFRLWESKHDNIDMEEAYIKLLIASTIQYFMPGIPVVFAGTEIGLTGYKDPFNRKPYPNQLDDQNKKFLEYYRHLGKFRRMHREFFSIAGEIQINASHEHLEIIRSNQYGKMTLYATRNAYELEKGWRVSVTKHN